MYILLIAALSLILFLFLQIPAFKYRLSIYLFRYIKIKRSIYINSLYVGSKNKLGMFSYDIPVFYQIFLRRNSCSKIESHNVGKILGIGSIKWIVVDRLSIKPHKLLDGTNRRHTIRISLTIQERLDALRYCF